MPGLYLCIFVGDLFASLLPLIGQLTIQVTNGSEGRRRHAMYSRCFTPSAIRQYYDVYNQVTVSFASSLGLFVGTDVTHMSH